LGVGREVNDPTQKKCTVMKLPEKEGGPCRRPRPTQGCKTRKKEDLNFITPDTCRKQKTDRNP
jgi:hypothetical protein